MVPMGGNGNNLGFNGKKESAFSGSFFFWCVIFCLGIVLDQFAKASVSKSTIFRNYLFAFSLPVPERLIYLIYALIFLWMVYYVVRHYQNFDTVSKLAWTLIFTGAVSNIGERIILGYVRDFIHINFYKWTGIYNLADFLIILGIVMLIIPFKINRRGHDFKDF